MNDTETLAALREACREWLKFDNDLDPCDPDTDIVAYEREKMEITERVAALVFPDTEHDPAVTGCEGHPAGPFDQMGVTTYCDGSCNG